MVVANLAQIMRASAPDVMAGVGSPVRVYPGANFERAYRPAMDVAIERAIPPEAEKYAVRMAEQGTTAMGPARASLAVSGQGPTEAEVFMGELARQQLPLDPADYGQRVVALSGNPQPNDWSDRRLMDIDVVPVTGDLLAPLRPAAPVEVAAPVAQAVQRGGAKDPPRRRSGGGPAPQPPAAGAAPAPADAPAENTPAAQVAEATEKATFDLVDAAWNRPDFGLIQDALVEHQGWTRDDAQIAARVAAGGLASIVGIPLLAAALSELNG